MNPKKTLHPFFVPGDIDGFFGLFVDNLCQLLLILGLCPTVAGLPLELVLGRILPGIAVTLVLGNVYYAFQARRLALRSGHPVTALPFGVNTVSLFAFIFLILAPVYHQTHDSQLAWKVALAAGFLGGVLEIIASYFGEWVRRHTPRAALLAPLAGTAITFISMGFVFQIFNSPLLALFPALIILLGYAGHIHWPKGIPTGLIAVGAGTALGWGLRYVHLAPWPEMPTSLVGFYFPYPIFGEVLSLLTSAQVWSYASVFIPMALINVIASIQNLESAAAAGDKFDTRSTLLVNGHSALIGVLFGNPFAPTIYIGHPGWKSMGARSGYSILNAFAVTALCLTGTLPWVLWFIPIEVTLGILLWVGLIITAQAFQQVPKNHAPAVAIGFIPPLAAWAELLIETTLRKAGPGYTLGQVAAHFAPDLYIYGLLSLAQGFILISIFFSAILASAIDHRWRVASGWATLAAIFSALGIIHGFVFTASGFGPALFYFDAPREGIPVGFDFAAVYAFTSLLLLALSFRKHIKLAEH